MPGLNTGSLIMPAAVADPKQSLDSEQISPATIAHHTVCEKIPNLHQSHMCRWGAQPYLVGPLSRLVGKPPFSPWLSRNILPLKRAANGPNSAISLTQTFDRISFCVYNSLYFGVQKAKNGDRGTIVFTATLTHTPHLCELLHFTPYVSLLQTDTFRMQPPICVPKYVAIYSEGGKRSPQTPNTFPHIRPR